MVIKCLTSTHVANQHIFVPSMDWSVTEKLQETPILWMEELLHQLVDTLSYYNPSIYSVSSLPIVTNWCRISIDFLYPQYVMEKYPWFPFIFMIFTNIWRFPIIIQLLDWDFP